jgi:hypothetical protein
MLHHGYEAPLQNQTYRWTYQVTYQCTETVGRVLDRDIRIRSEEELALMLNSYAFIPWFEPDDTYHGTKVFDGENLPELIVRSVEEAAEQTYSPDGSRPFRSPWDQDRADATQADLDNEFGIPSSISYEELRRVGGAPDFGFEQFDEEEDDEDFDEEDEDEEVDEAFVEEDEDGDESSPPSTSPEPEEETDAAGEELDEEEEEGSEQEESEDATEAE